MGRGEVRLSMIAGFDRSQCRFPGRGRGVSVLLGSGECCWGQMRGGEAGTGAGTRRLERRTGSVRLPRLLSTSISKC